MIGMEEVATGREERTTIRFAYWKTGFFKNEIKFKIFLVTFDKLLMMFTIYSVEQSLRIKIIL